MCIRDRNKIATANKSRGKTDIVWAPKHRIKFAMTVLGKVAPPLAHMNHTLSDKSIRKLPRYAQDAIDKSKSTVEQYRNEVQKGLHGTFMSSNSNNGLYEHHDASDISLLINSNTAAAATAVCSALSLPL